MALFPPEEQVHTGAAQGEQGQSSFSSGVITESHPALGLSHPVL